MMVRAPRDEDGVHLEFEIGQCRSALELLKEKEVTKDYKTLQNNTKTAKDCKSGRGKLQIHIMHIEHTQVTRQDNSSDSG